MYGFNYQRTFKTIEDFQDEIFSGEFENKYIFCHFAEFDLNVIFDNIKKLDRESIFNGSTFIIASKDKVMFADSLNIYKTSVKELGKIIGLPKLDLDSGFGSGKRFAITDEHIKYCMRDCEIVWKALEKIFMEVQSVRPTLASLSMIYFRRFYQDFHIAYNDKTKRFFDSYYGGRVEAFKLGKTHSFKYDINSMYPYIMTTAVFPNPKFLQVSDSTDVEGLLYDMKYYEGQATISVIHKKNNFGFLPVKHEGKLVFPNGKFSGTWCFPEIRFALRNKIIEITDVKEVIFSHPLETPFKKFSIELYQARLKSEGIDKVVKKLLMNSLYGKFAQREKHKELYFENVPFDMIEVLQDYKIPYDLKMFNKDRNDCYLIIYNPKKARKTKEGYELEYSNGDIIILKDYSIYTEKEIRNLVDTPKIHTIPVFSSYITSLARVYLLENMLRYSKNKVTYVDTDCICIEKDLVLQDSIILGEFKKEPEILTEIFGNKNYREFNNGEENRKIKGIPKKANLLSENLYEYDGFIKTKKAIRHNKKAGSIETFTKLITNKYDKRNKNETTGATTPLLFV